jgi:hypothetical protein
MIERAERGKEAVKLGEVVVDLGPGDAKRIASPVVGGSAQLDILPSLVRSSCRK